MNKIFSCKNNGTITIEAAISLIITMSVVLTLSLFARIAYVQGVVQHALVQTANEMATYSYFYSLTGLNQINGAIVKRKLTADSTVSDAKDTVTEAIDNVKNVYDKFTAHKYGDAGKAIGKVRSSADGLKDINVLDVLKSFAIAAAGEAVETTKTEAFNKVTIPLMQTYMPSDMKKFNRLGMFVKTDGYTSADDAQYIKDDSFPLDLSYSSYFSNMDADEINLVAVYEIKPIAPIPIIDKPITIAQTAKARAWMAEWKRGSVSEGETESTTDVWSLPSAERAKKIRSTNPALDLPQNFKCFSGFDSGSGRASIYITIDIRDPSYTGKSSSIKSAIKSKINAAANFESYKLAGRELKEEDIRSVDYYVYIPAAASDSDKAAVRTAVESSELELGSGKKVPLNVIIKEI